MMQRHEALNMILNTVYESLFGLSRATMLSIAKRRKDYAIGLPTPALWSRDEMEDEAMRDCFSLEALTALNVVEGNLAKKLDMLTLVTAKDVTAAVKSLERVVKDECETYIKQHGKVEPIWHALEGEE